MSTPGWLSLYVEKTCSFFVGIVVFLLMSTVCSSTVKPSAAQLPPMSSPRDTFQIQRGEQKIDREAASRHTGWGWEAYHDTSSRLQTQGQGGDIQQQQVLHLLTALSAQNGSLRGSSLVTPHTEELAPFLGSAVLHTKLQATLTCKSNNAAMHSSRKPSALRAEAVVPNARSLPYN